MTGLEDSILKKNIPGKCSTWSDYKDEEDFDDTSLSNSNGLNHNNQQQHIPRIENSGRLHNTGVKGVIADHKEAKELEKIILAQEQIQREEAFRRATEGARLKPGETSYSLASIERRKQEERNKDDSDNNSESSDDDDDFLDDESDDFLNTYRQMRLTELQNNALPIFGNVKELTTTDEFSNMIDETDSRIFCIFHLFDDGVKSCRLVNQYFDALARKMDRCRFFKMEASIVNQNFDPIGFPCVLIYKGGNEVANLTPITLMFKKSTSTHSSHFTIEDVESVLDTYCDTK